MQKEFILLYKNLLKNGFEVELNDDEELKCKFMRFVKEDIRGYAGEKHDPNNLYSNARLNGKICADNDGCFDKLSKCPIVIDLPRSDGEFNLLLKELEFLGSVEGYNLSNEYEYELINSYDDLIK